MLPHFCPMGSSGNPHRLRFSIIESRGVRGQRRDLWRLGPRAADEEDGQRQGDGDPAGAHCFPLNGSQAWMENSVCQAAPVAAESRNTTMHNWSSSFFLSSRLITVLGPCRTSFTWSPTRGMKG